ncbi:MAG TPA: hypothetical protein PKI19_00155 [Elusimicrobiales bacterium]|nr:hypothetical protein [Elusimicrobiales bacterium]
MKTVFSEMLGQLRTQAGFETAYKFYHKNGGQGVLKMSYRNYLNLEQGRSLPPLERLGTLTWALRIHHGSAEANALVSAWLRSMAGEDNFRDYLAPLLAPKPAEPPLSPASQALKKFVDAGTGPLSLEQVRAIHLSENHCLCATAMNCERGALSIRELAERLELPEATAAKVMRDLAGAKLVKEVKKDVYRNSAGMSCKRAPGGNIIPEDIKQKIRGTWRKLEAAGKVVYPYRVIMRADEKDSAGLFNMMDTHMAAVQAYAVDKGSASTALFMVEARITRLRKF